VNIKISIKSNSYDIVNQRLRVAANTAMERLFFTLGCVSAFIAVVLGAFAAHVLKGRVGADLLVVFETGVRYQMYHAFALLAVAWASTRWPGKAVRTSGWLFVIGTIIFSGSLYALSLSGVRWLGAITPVGGVALLAGWLCLAWAAYRAP
jgi:uncharacterized membrane protein YgdD (TMEM256/DUF423 family)